MEGAGATWRPPSEPRSPGRGATPAGRARQRRAERGKQGAAHARARCPAAPPAPAGWARAGLGGGGGGDAGARPRRRERAPPEGRRGRPVTGRRRGGGARRRPPRRCGPGLRRARPAEEAQLLASFSGQDRVTQARGRPKKESSGPGLRGDAPGLAQPGRRAGRQARGLLSFPVATQKQRADDCSAEAKLSLTGSRPPAARSFSSLTTATTSGRAGEAGGLAGPLATAALPKPPTARVPYLRSPGIQEAKLPAREPVALAISSQLPAWRQGALSWERRARGAMQGEAAFAGGDRAACGEERSPGTFSASAHRWVRSQLKLAFAPRLRVRLLFSP